MLACGLDLFSFLAVGKNLVLWLPEMAPLAKMPFDIQAMPFDVGDMLFGILIALFVVPVLICVLYFFSFETFILRLMLSFYLLLGFCLLRCVCGTVFSRRDEIRW